MCGIAGLVCGNAACRDETHVALVRQMCDLQTHRGPDDSGVVAIDNVCLGSNRLAIIDLSAAGHMPMSDSSDGWWIVYNGEMYNFKSLRDELERLGHEFVSHTDTEVILHAFKEWGEASLDRFLGMFAFAIYDPRSKTVTLVRDRFGKKPLYYTERGGHILFSSELKTLMRVTDHLRPNQQRLIEWSLYRNADFGSRETLIEDMYSLPPGHLLKIEGGRIGKARRYYSPEAHVDRARYEELGKRAPNDVIDDLDRLLQTCVVDRLISDVPLGTLCSGGIDSSLITAVCARTVGKDLAAFNVAVAGYADLDENRYAKIVADSLGIKLQTYAMSAADFRRNLPRAIYHSDAPLTHPNSIAFLLISEFARSRGVKILLSGEAADELFGGYMHRYRRHGQLLKAKRWLERLPPRVRKAIALLGYASEGVPTAELYEGLMAHATAFLDKFAREDLRIRSEEAYAFVANETERAVMGMMLADITDFLTPLLRRLDRMSMAASVECRVPFLDHRLVHTAINLPLSFKLHGRTDKWAIKEIAARYLPKDIVHRHKVGFPLPVADYLEPLADPRIFDGGFCVDVLGMHERGLREAIVSWRGNVHGFFNLLALEVWGRLFFLNEPLDKLTDRLACA